MQGRHHHKLIDRNDSSARYPTFFNGENISGHIELKLNSKTLKHKGIKAELHGILEKYGTINKTKSFLNISSDISRPEEITQEKVYLNFNFQNAKLPYESYKGDYATVKYFVRIIIIATYKNAEYEKEFAVVNPNESSILKKNDEPIRMQVGIKQKLSLSIYFQHKNYNCRGTLKGFISFNYINIPLTFMEVQIVRREIIFGDKKCEPAYVARYELIDGFPTKNERIPIRFFLKSYNLTPTYPNIDDMFCVRYFLNLVIADEEENRYFKQKEICLFRLYKERKNICNYNYYNNENRYYNNEEIFITEPIYEEDFSLDYQPAFARPNNIKQNNNFKDDDDYLDNYGINTNITSINEDESYDLGYNINNINNDGRNRNNIRNDSYNNNERFNNNNFNINNRNNTFNNNRNNEINRVNDENDNNYKNIINNNNYNRNRTYNNAKNESNNIFNDNYIEEDEGSKNLNDNYNNRNNNRINNNYFNENDNNYINNNIDNRNRKNNYNQNRINTNNKNKNINNNPSNYYSIKTKNNSNTYDEYYMYNDDMNDRRNNLNNAHSNNYRRNNNNVDNNINNDISPLEKKSSHSHRNNLMQTRISSEEDFKNIFDTLDKNINKEELKKNIFG